VASLKLIEKQPNRLLDVPAIFHASDGGAMNPQQVGKLGLADVAERPPCLGDPVLCFAHKEVSAKCTTKVKCQMHDFAAHNRAMGTPLSDRLKFARERAGFTGPDGLRRAAEALGVNRSTYTQHENGTRGFKRDAAVQYARKFKVPLDWLLTGRGDLGPRKARNQLVGKVGAGAEIIRPDEGVHLGDSFLPDDLPPGNVAEISGDSQYPLQDGWLIVYGPEYQGISEACIGKLCVVGVKEGPILLKTLKRGSRKGVWRLESWNAPPREDVELQWAARVISIRLR
jgi:transcriptional regulator with XRE-family HTH domain